MLTALSGACNQPLYGQNLEHTPVFSEAEFQEMMQIASLKFCDLPHPLLNQIKWKIKLSEGLAPKDHLPLSPFNMPMHGQSGVFAVDSHPLGLCKVRFLDWRGMIKSEVKALAGRPVGIDGVFM